MAKISQLIRFLQLNNYHSHFALEILLFGIATFTVGANLTLANASARADIREQSLFFLYLRQHQELNSNLVDAYESINLKVAEAGLPAASLVLAASTKEKNIAAIKNAGVPLPTLAGTALMKPNPAGPGVLPKKDIQVYEVRGGDTVARIASAYGVSQNTIIWENGLSSDLIKPGQTLRILPTNGVKHMIKDGETLEGVAKKYGVDLEDVLEYNEIEIEDHILAGEEIIIPNGVKKTPPTPARQRYLADLQKEDVQRGSVPSDYQGSSTSFIWPLPSIRRISQYFWSRHKALDIPCRDCPVVAAAEGIVEISGWQKGYGNTILLNHGNDYRTRYGHGSKLLVSAGQSVAQGQTIMLSGSTGRSSGPHLHFEIKKGSTYLNPLPIAK